jgi:hypothetical protein
MAQSVRLGLQGVGRGTVGVEVVGQKRLSRMLKDLEGNALNPMVALHQAAVRVQQETDQLWAGPRKPLKASTIARKRRHGLPTTPLVAHGDLKVSAAVIDVHVTPRYLRLRVDPPQAEYQIRLGRPVLPPTKQIAGIVMGEVYKSLDVDR